MGNKVVIVGGVAGGASCAARLRRLDEDAEIILFERGEYISYANCGLPYHVGDVIKSRQALLLQTPEAMRVKYNIDVRIHSEVTSIDRQNKTVAVKNAEFEEKFAARNGSLICKRLLGYDLTEPEEMALINEKQLLTTLCPCLVCSACEILDEIF